MGRTTLRRILVNAGLSSPRRRRPPKHRVRRQRMPREGMLIQMDGSYHRWLGEDGPQFTILFAVDDATGCVPGALFCDHEDTSSYFLLMQGMLRRRGIPLVLYTDRHAVFKHRSEYHPAGTPTQFGRAMEELGTQLIFALSPQAKGRLSLQHEGRIIAAQEAPPSPASLRGRNGTSPAATIPTPRYRTRVETFGCSSRSAGRKARSRRGCSRCSDRRSGRSRFAGRRIAAEADVPAAGEMEGGAAGQASGDVHSTNG